jgi:exonuclease SbcC
VKIAHLYLKAYGAFSGRRLDFDNGDGANFHVIYGPNEAGKSTTLRALAGLLFGIDDRTGDSFLHPNPQLRVGATLVPDQGARLSVMRRKGRKQTLFALDEASGAELTDQPLPEDALSRLLGGLDEGLYHSLFGLDMEGLARGSEALLAGKGEIGQSLFEAAAGMTSLQQLLGRLDSDASHLFRPRATTSVINIAIRELEEKRKLVRDAKVSPHAWEQADRNRRQAEAKYASIRDELTVLRREQRLLSRISVNLPLAAERAAKLAELATLGHVPPLPPEAAQHRIEAEERLRNATEDQRQATAEVERLQHKRSSLTVREALIVNSATIERLHHAAKDWRGAMERLPRIGKDIDIARRSIASHVSAIAPELAGMTIEQARALIPSPVLTARLQVLGNQYATLHAQNEQLEERARKAADTLNRLRRDLEAHPEPAPLDVLATARERAVAEGGITARQSSLNKEIAAMEVAVIRDASVLWNGTLDELAALRIPLTATIKEFEAGYRQVDEAQRALQSKDDELARDIDDRERELRGLAAAGEIATPAQVQAARAHRDDGWRRVRQQYIERTIERTAVSDGLPTDFPSGPSLPAAYEGAVREADRLADILHAHAERSANYETTRQRIADMHKTRAGLSIRRDALNAERARLDSRWAAVTGSLGQMELTPAAAVEWCRNHANWVERYMKLGALKQTRQEIADLLAMTRTDLGEALTACGLPGLAEGESLAAALLRAKAAVDAAQQAATARAALVAQIAHQVLEQVDITSQQARADEKMKHWQNQWSESVTALRLPAGALPAEASARIDEFDALNLAIVALDGLTRESEAEHGKRSSFEDELSTLATEMGEVGEVGEPGSLRDADHLVAKLYEQLATAREADQLRKQTDGIIERETARLQQAQLAAEAQRERLAELVSRAGVQSQDELPLVEANAARKQLLSGRIDEIGEQLVRSAAKPLAEVLAEVEGHDISTTAARLTEIEAIVKDHELEAETAHAHLLEANREFDAIDGSDAAAQAQQEAEELIARIAWQARIYARTRLAEVIVSRVVQAYRERHQGPVLRRAGEIFAKITLGSFSGLVTDYEDDAQILLGQRPDAVRVGVAGMSQGTRDQLFLSLRIAAIEEHLKQRETIPLVIDDLLVQFDDARASATLPVLADLSRQTQVLFFTHHEHLCELAASALRPGTWRRHDLA